MKYWREILIVVLVIVCIISMRSCNVSNTSHKADKQLLENAKDSAFLYTQKIKLDNGKLAARVKTHEVTIDQLETYNKELGFDLEATKKQIGSLNNLVGYWKVKAEVKQTIVVIGRDTTIYSTRDTTKVQAKVFHYNNGYLRLDQVYNPINLELATTYHYNPSFNLTAYRKGGGLFKKGQLVTDVVFDDPNIQTSTVNSIVIKEGPEKFYQTKVFVFGLGVTIGVVGTVYLVTHL